VKNVSFGPFSDVLDVAPNADFGQVSANDNACGARQVSVNHHRRGATDRVAGFGPPRLFELRRRDASTDR
jgi:hypothetical protein